MNVLIKRMGAIGDVLACEPAMRAIRAKHPGDNIYMQTRCVEQLDRCPHLNGVFHQVPSSLDIDYTYDLTLSYESRPNKFRMAAICDSVGVKYPGPSRYWLTPTAERTRDRYRIGKDDKTRLAVINGWAGWPCKMWDVIRWKKLEHWLKSSGWRVIEVCEAGKSVGVGETFNGTWWEAVGVIAAADVFIGTDSSPMWVALGLGIPTVALFGPTSPEITSDHPHFYPVKSNDPSNGCHHRGKYPKTKCECDIVLPHKGMDAITVENVCDQIERATYQKMNQPQRKEILGGGLHIRGHVNSWTGFGRLLLESHYGLAQRGISSLIDPRIIDHVNLSLPEGIENLVSSPAKGDHVLIIDGLMFSGHRAETNRTAAFTMWEVSGVPSHLVKELNKTSFVITPSRFCADVFAAAGVSRPIKILPLGIDPAEYEDSDPGIDPNVIRFGCMGWVSKSYFRKGIDDVVAAFRAAFPKRRDDVRLEVKVWPGCIVRGWEGDLRITINRSSLSRKELVKWFRSLSVFVSASKGEGWGLCSHEALAAGRPVIGTNWGGQGEILNENTGILVPYRLEPPTDKAYRGLGRWAVPDMDALVEAMRMAAEDPVKLMLQSQSGMNRARSFTWSKMADGLAKILRSERFV